MKNIKNGGCFNVCETNRRISIKKIGFGGVILKVVEHCHMIHGHYVTIDMVISKPEGGIIKYLSNTGKEYKVPAFVLPGKYLDMFMSDDEYAEISELFSEWVGKVFNDENSYWLQR